MTCLREKIVSVNVKAEHMNNHLHLLFLANMSMAGLKVSLVDSSLKKYLRYKYSTYSGYMLLGFSSEIREILYPLLKSLPFDERNSLNY